MVFLGGVVPSYDVAIVGGGVVGCAIARELSRFRLSAVLLEANAEVGFGTSKTNSGIIHPGHDTPLSTLKGRLVVRGNAMYDRLCAELKFGFRRIGELNVALREDEVASLHALKAMGDDKGVPGLEMWDQERLRREEPNLSRDIVAALYCPSAGVINPYEFAFALAENAEANGVEIRVDSPVTGIDLAGDGLLVRAQGGDVTARHVLNCAGVHAERVAAMVGAADFRILPRKGEEYMLDRRLKGLVRRLVFPLPTAKSKGILIIPTFDGTIMVGPTADDVDDPEDVATTSAGAERVFGQVRRLCPSISARDAITAFAGVRAVADSGDFVIRATPVRGFVNVAGIQSPGLTSAPAIAEYVRDLLGGEGLRLDERDDWSPEVRGPARFALCGHAEQERLVASNPAFGRVVCRCELVTEAEVEEAMDHGARTLDGIKFRTRAGMGRCQGGFCTSRCMEALARRMGVPIERVTKRGGGSWVLQPMDDEA